MKFGFPATHIARALCFCVYLVGASTTVTAQVDGSKRNVTVPLPPPRPFDLFLPGGQSNKGLGSALGAPLGQTPSDATQPNDDPAPKAVSNVPAPPRRPDVAPLSTAENEEEEPARTWPRRTPGQSTIEFEPRMTPQDDVIANGITSDPGTSTRCLPQPLQRVLNALVTTYGAVRVTSTFRPVWRARRNSFHRRCEAMDIRIPGQSPRTVLDFVKTLPETGGHKVYWNGIVHVDIGPWRTW